MSERSNTIKAVGLYTYLSELQAPEGSNVIADNVNIDELGVITPRRGFNDYGQELQQPSDRLSQILEYKNTIIRHFNNYLQYDDGTGNFNFFSGSFNEVEKGFRIKAEEVNGNYYFTSSDGIKKISATDASQFNTSPNYIVNAGVSKALELSGKTLPSESGFLPPQSKVAYKVLFGYKDNNNVLILGSPTARYVIANNSSDVAIPEQSTIQILQQEVDFVKAEFAQFNDAITGVTGNVKLIADNSGIIGDDIVLNGDGVKDLNTLIDDWNTANPSNTVTLTSINGADIPDAATVMQLDGGVDGVDFIYIGKYFTIDTLDQSYFVWFSETGADTQIPQDENTIGKVGIEVRISAADDPDTIAQKTTNVLFNELIDYFSVSVVSTIIPFDTIRFVSKQKGNLEDITSGNLVESTDVVTRVVQQGDVSKGTSANCEISTVIPEGITTDYFVQFYRTSVITAIEGLSINDIDPGEDCNLVYEEPVTQPAGSTITIKDITPNSFRDTGTPLYNNPISGQGILQSNDAPPIAKDIENFNNFTFYANTKTYHRTQFTFLSVDDFGNQETSLTIGNSEIAREYVFQGTQEITEIICDTVDNTIQTFEFATFKDTVNGVVGIVELIADTSGVIGNLIQLVGDGVKTLDTLASEWNTDNPTNTVSIVSVNESSVPDLGEVIQLEGGNDSYIIIYSANDIRKYVIWFDKGTGAPPLIDYATPIRVDISSDGILGTDNVATYLELALLDFPDFLVSYDGINKITITNENNGYTTNAQTPTNDISVDVGAGWSINIIEGIGEDTSTNRVLWSILPSVSQSIEETARSFIKVVNQDTLSPVKATYLSGENDLPGLILLENRQLADIPFYLAVKNVSNIGDNIKGEFNPELPVVNNNNPDLPSSANSIINIAQNPLDLSKTRITTANQHLLNTGDSIYLYAGSNNPAISDKFIITKFDDFNFDIDVESIAPDSTGAFFFKTTIQSDNQVKPNRIYYSKLSQPESVPIANYIDVGGKDDPIERILALRDTLFILKTDGTYTLTGTSAPFSVRLLDNTSTIIAPDSAVVLNNQIFALMDDGVSIITESGSSVISRSIEDKILNVTGVDVDFRLKTFGVAYENDKAYILWMPSTSEDTAATQAFRYNHYERTWTRWTVSATCARASKNNVLYLGEADRPYLSKERKNRNRLDYSDRNFTRQVLDNSVLSGNRVRLSTLDDVKVGDVMVQDQYVTIDIFNNLLQKLDFDSGISLYASFDAPVAGISTGNVRLKAQTSNGNSIVLVGDGVKDLETLVEEWNTSNSSNTVALLSTNGIPDSGELMQLSGGKGKDYEETLQVKAGDNIGNKLEELNIKLISQGINVTLLTWFGTIEDIRDSYNNLMDQLNQNLSGTVYKTYRKVTRITTYESIIERANTLRPDINEVVTLIECRFFEGDIEVWKAIDSTIQWNPLHFGDPSAQKQFSKGTIVVDQNNFTKATVSYASELSQGFVDIEKEEKVQGIIHHLLMEMLSCIGAEMEMMLLL